MTSEHNETAPTSSSKPSSCPSTPPVCPKSSSTARECTLCDPDDTSIVDVVCSRSQGPILASAADGPAATESALLEARTQCPNEPSFAQRRHAAFLLAKYSMLREAVDQYNLAIEEYDTLLQRVGVQKDSQVSPAEAAEAAAVDPAAALAIDTYADFLPFCLNEVGILLTRHNRVCDALGYFDRAIQHLCHAIKFGDARGNFRERNSCLLLETKKHMACALKSAGEFAFACKLFLQLMGVYRSCTFYGSKLLLSDCAYHVAEMLNSEGKFQQAEPIIRECVDIRRHIFGGDDDNMVRQKMENCKPASTLAEGQCPSGKTTDTQSLCHKVASQKSKRFNSSATEISLALCLLAATIASPVIGKYEEAELAIDEALELVSSCRSQSTVCEDEIHAMRLMKQSISQAKQQTSMSADHDMNDMNDHDMNDDDFDDTLVDIDADI